MKDYYSKVKWFNFKMLALLELWKIALLLSLITSYLSEMEKILNFWFTVTLSVTWNMWQVNQDKSMRNCRSLSVSRSLSQQDGQNNVMEMSLHPFWDLLKYYY